MKLQQLIHREVANHDLTFAAAVVVYLPTGRQQTNTFARA